jgi:hypothetical protein
MSGQARFRFGGTTPLIGIVPWGVVANKDLLIVPENSINYGYNTRKPVSYPDKEPDPRLTSAALLQQHHSHFILVRLPICYTASNKLKT